MLDVYVGSNKVGRLFQSSDEENTYYFAYDANVDPCDAISLSMPVTPEQFDAHYNLHPIFDMNLPEGELGRRLRSQFSKAMPNFNDLSLLGIVGKSQIGRLQFHMAGHQENEIPETDLNNLIRHDGAEELFEELLARYAVHSGVSGVQPKVLVRSNREETDNDPARITYKGATHIVKAWDKSEPQLAANEYFCMRAAKESKIPVPKFSLSENGKFLVVARFDLENGCYKGFEDFCVLNGMVSSEKYNSSYERVARRIKDFVSAAERPGALENYFKILSLSCAVKNGDAHLKNFGVLYENAGRTIRLAPAYDIVSTTPYIKEDSMALTLGGTKRWPDQKKLLKFAQVQCGIAPMRAKKLLAEVSEGVLFVANELKFYQNKNTVFKKVGNVMLSEWQEGLNYSVLSKDDSEKLID